MKAIREIPESGLGLVLKSVHVPKGEEGTVKLGVELKEARALRLKWEDIPGLDPVLSSDELAMEEAVS